MSIPSSPAPDLEPRTEAGRRFLEDLTKEHCSDPHGCHAADDSLAGMAVLAIEAEAAAESGRLREALDVERLARQFHDMLGLLHHPGCGWQFASEYDGTPLCPCPSVAAKYAALLATPPAPSDHGAGERQEANRREHKPGPPFGWGGAWDDYYVARHSKDATRIAATKAAIEAAARADALAEIRAGVEGLDWFTGPSGWASVDKREVLALLDPPK